MVGCEHRCYVPQHGYGGRGGIIVMSADAAAVHCAPSLGVARRWVADRIAEPVHLFGCGTRAGDLQLLFVILRLHRRVAAKVPCHACDCVHMHDGAAMNLPADIGIKFVEHFAQMLVGAYGMSAPRNVSTAVNVVREPAGFTAPATSAAPRMFSM